MILEEDEKSDEEPDYATGIKQMGETMAQEILENKDELNEPEELEIAVGAFVDSLKHQGFDETQILNTVT